MNKLAQFFPWLVVSLAVVYLLVAMVPPADISGQMYVREFGELPVLDGGRYKPIDTFARINLMVISGKQTFKDEDGNPQPAVKWLLDVMASQFIEKDPVPALEHKVFRIENEEVLALLGLEPRSGLRYALNEFKDKMGVLEKAANRAGEVPSAEQTKFDIKVLELARHVHTFMQLAIWKIPAIVPPRSGKSDEWKSFWSAMEERHRGEPANPAAELLREALVGYIVDKPETFNSKVAAYQKQIASRLPGEAAQSGFEVFFNHFDPFYQCALLYGVVFILAVCAWIGWRQPLSEAAFRLAIVVLLLHTFALIARMVLQGRPPVTNLYSSAVFIGWGAMTLCLGIEYLFRNGIGTLVASILGGFTMIIALHLAESGDTLEMMEAVLDTNFWLATHVTCVTLGYTATFVAGNVATVAILLAVFSRLMDKTLTKTFSQIVYGVVCFATLLSFTGTVLGGIWADQSWGRFWGWDPKENGALLIVVWNALILHARWGGLIKDRGLFVLAVVGNMITTWSWFGTNQLSVGLHAYGFNSTLALGCRYYWLSQLGLIGLATLWPQRFWLSNRVNRPRPEAPSSGVRPWKGGDKAELVTSI